MKKLTKCSLTAKFFALIFSIMLSVGAVNATAAEKAAVTTEARAQAIQQRVAEIQAMDFSKLSATERKDLRNELKDMKQEVRQHPVGIYVSGVGLVIIILLLILLL